MKKLFFGILPFVILLASCSKDGKGIGDGGKEPGKIEAKDLNLAFDVVMPNQAQPNPNQKSPSTYALSEVDENTVAVIDVLAFLENGANMEFAEWAKVAGTSISDNGSVSKKKFKVNFTKLVQSPTHKYQFVVIANGRGSVQSLFTGGGAITTGALKDAVMERLKLEGVEGWVSKTTDPGYLHMPMWGEGSATVVTTGLAISDIKLLRMLAKINVTIDATTGVRSKFLLRSIDLYNYNKDGRVVPDAINLVTPSKVDKPTNIGVHTEGPVKYVATSVTEMEENIYTFESKVPYVGVSTVVNLDDVICLVIGGEFGTDGKTTYYRVDLAKKNAQGKYDYMNILRNHGYNINITNVASSGYDDSYSAFKARAVNIDVDIEAWDESEMDLSYDGQYQLGTDKNKINFFAEGREQTMLVFADHPNGWEIETATLPSWITITPMSDNSASTKEIKITASAWAGPGDRLDEFFITAGLLKKKIRVEQTSDPEISLDVSPSSITFRKSASFPKSFTVKTFPEDLAKTFTVTHTSVNQMTSSTWPVSGSTASQFTLKLDENTTGTTLSSTITISVEHAGKILTKAITIIQESEDMIFTITNNTSPYPAVGGAAFFSVESVAPWRLSTSASFVSGHNTNEMVGTERLAVSYNFVLAPNVTFEIKKAIFNAASSDIDFPVQDITVTQGFAAHYMTVGSNLANFGTGNVAQNVTVKTNAGWVVTSISNTNVLSSNLPAVGAVQVGSVSALVDASGTIALSPRTDYKTFGAAGRELSSVVKIESRNHTGATTKTHNITVKRNAECI